MTETTEKAPIGRNEPCPCGSGKKYKRCCGVNAAPKLVAPKPAGLAEGGAAPDGFDPRKLAEQMDPAWMAQVSQAIQRLPKGQMQRLQALMQKAMSGKDVSREAAEFEGTLPVEVQQLFRSFSMPGMPGMPGAPDMAASEAPSEVVASEPAEMSEEEARKLVARAAAEGKISAEDAAELLTAQEGAQGGPVAEAPEASEKGMSRLWNKIVRKN